MEPLQLGSADLAEIQKRLEAAIRRGCPPGLSQQREDLVQQAVERVLKVFSGNPDKCLNGSYLKRVAFSVIVEARKKHDDVISEHAEQVPARRSEDPEAYATGRDIARAVADCMEQVAPSRRAAVGVYLQGATLAQTARALGEDRKKRIENQVYRGLADLRKCLEHKGVTP